MVLLMSKETLLSALIGNKFRIFAQVNSVNLELRQHRIAMLTMWICVANRHYGHEADI